MSRSNAPPPSSSQFVVSYDCKPQFIDATSSTSLATQRDVSCLLTRNEQAHFFSPGNTPCCSVCWIPNEKTLFDITKMLFAVEVPCPRIPGHSGISQFVKFCRAACLAQNGPRFVFANKGKEEAFLREQLRLFPRAVKDEAWGTLDPAKETKDDFALQSALRMPIPPGAVGPTFGSLLLPTLFDRAGWRTLTHLSGKTPEEIGEAAEATLENPGDVRIMLAAPGRKKRKHPDTILSSVELVSADPTKVQKIAPVLFDPATAVEDQLGMTRYYMSNQELQFLGAKGVLLTQQVEKNSFLPGTPPDIDGKPAAIDFMAVRLPNDNGVPEHMSFLFKVPSTRENPETETIDFYDRYYAASTDFVPYHALCPFEPGIKVNPQSNHIMVGGNPLKVRHTADFVRRFHEQIAPKSFPLLDFAVDMTASGVLYLGGHRGWSTKVA